MKRVRVKICGMTNIEDAVAAIEAKADAIGFVFAASPRQVTPEAARLIVKALPSGVETVGVFVNSTADEMLAVAARVGLSAIQLHGDEPPSVVQQVYDKGFKIIKAFRVADRDDLVAAMSYLNECSVDACLVDARVDGAYGGTGKVAPWDMIGTARGALWPLMLGGGLNPQNVAEAIRAVQPYGVEASSGIESEPGRKDHQAMRQFIEKAASCQVGDPGNYKAD